MSSNLFQPESGTIAELLPLNYQSTSVVYTHANRYNLTDKQVVFVGGVYGFVCGLIWIALQVFNSRIFDADPLRLAGLIFSVEFAGMVALALWMHSRNIVGGTLIGVIYVPVFAVIVLAFL